MTFDEGGFSRAVFAGQAVDFGATVDVDQGAHTGVAITDVSYRQHWCPCGVSFRSAFAPLASPRSPGGGAGLVRAAAGGVRPPRR